MKSINESTIKYVKGKNESYNLYWAVGGLAHAWVIMYNIIQIYSSHELEQLWTRQIGLK